MGKEERFIYHCDNYDYTDIIYDTKKHEECDSMQMATKWLNRQDQKISDLEAKLAESEKPKEIRFNGFVVDCNYDEARKVLQKDILKMQEENKKLKESEELSNYAKCILENKKLEEDLELSEKCCVEYEQEILELKQQLAEKDKLIQEYEKIVEQKDEEISFANRDKTYIVKQLNDPKDYVLLEDYKKVEQQLAEWQDGTIICKWTDAENKIKELEQQLAEKDKEYQSFKKIADENVNYLKNRILEETKNYNQDKISFAIAELEKVKDKIKKLPCAMTLTTSAFEQIYKVDATRQIDNQIASLKKGDKIV